MNKKTVICSTVFAFLFSLVMTAGLCLAADTGPAEMTLETAAAKKPAQFPHKKHQKMYGCGECHHSSADGKQVPYTEGMKIEKCASCHDTMEDAKLKGFKGAAHTNCKGCHEKVSKEGKNAPTKCAGCHVKKAGKQVEGC